MCGFGDYVDTRPISIPCRAAWPSLSPQLPITPILKQNLPELVIIHITVYGTLSTAIPEVHTFTLGVQFIVALSPCIIYFRFHGYVGGRPVNCHYVVSL